MSHIQISWNVFCTYTQAATTKSLSQGGLKKDIIYFWRMKVQDQGTSQFGSGKSIIPDFLLIVFSMHPHILER